MKMKDSIVINQRKAELMEYLRVLKSLNQDDFRCEKELNETLRELHELILLGKLDNDKNINDDYDNSNTSKLSMHLQGRGTGKTEKAVKMLKNDKDSILIVPRHTKDYYRNRFSLTDDLFERIFYIEDIVDRSKQSKLRGFRSQIKKVILDEGFSYNKTALIALYYNLGRMNLDVVVIGTDENK